MWDTYKERKSHQVASKKTRTEKDEGENKKRSGGPEEECLSQNQRNRPKFVSLRPTPHYTVMQKWACFSPTHVVCGFLSLQQCGIVTSDISHRSSMQNRLVITISRGEEEKQGQKPEEEKAQIKQLWFRSDNMDASGFSPSSGPGCSSAKVRRTWLGWVDMLQPRVLEAVWRGAHTHAFRCSLSLPLLSSPSRPALFCLLQTDS